MELSLAGAMASSLEGDTGRSMVNPVAGAPEADGKGVGQHLVPSRQSWGGHGQNVFAQILWPQ